MCGATRAELGGLARFAVKDAIVSGEAVLFDDAVCCDDLFAGGAGLADSPNILVALKRGIEELSVERRRLFADGEGAVNLCRVAPVADRQLGDADAAFIEQPRL